jgi:hypothetical protein
MRDDVTYARHVPWDHRARGRSARTKSHVCCNVLCALFSALNLTLRPFAVHPLTSRPLALRLLTSRPLALRLHTLAMRPLALRPRALRPLDLRPHVDLLMLALARVCIFRLGAGLSLLVPIAVLNTAFAVANCTNALPIPRRPRAERR